MKGKVQLFMPGNKNNEEHIVLKDLKVTFIICK